MGDEALDFPQALFTIQVAEAEAAEGDRGVGDRSRKMSIKSHAIQEGTSGFPLDGLELGEGE